VLVESALNSGIRGVAAETLLKRPRDNAPDTFLASLANPHSNWSSACVERVEAALSDARKSLTTTEETP
jgi:hypothetical protein